MTAAPAVDESTSTTTAHSSYGLAKIGAWYLLIGALTRLVLQQFGFNNRVLGFVDTLAFGTAPTLSIFGLLGDIVRVLVLGLGLVFVLTRVRIGARIMYGIFVALGLLATYYVVLVGGYYGRYWNGSYVGYVRSHGFGGVDSFFYVYLLVELLGIALAIGAVIAIFVGLTHAGSQSARPTSAQVAAASAQRDQEWRVAEVKKWQEAYSLANNGEAPPAGFMPPISAPPSQLRGTNVMAILALVFGIGGGLLGVIFGHVALRQIKRTGESGRGLAIAGLILGYIGIALVIGWVVFVIVIANSNSYSYYG